MAEGEIKHVYPKLIHAEVSATVELGDRGNKKWIKADAGITEPVDPGSSIDDKFAELYALCKAKVKEQCTMAARKMEGKEE